MATTTTTTTTTVITKTNVVENGNKKDMLERAEQEAGNKRSTARMSIHKIQGVSSTPKATSTAAYQLSNSQKEINQNKLNDEKEKSFMGLSFNRFFGASRSLNQTNSMDEDELLNGDLSGHLAYLEYKKSGEYWK